MGQTLKILRKNKIASSNGKLFKMATLGVLQDFWYLRRRTFVNFFVVRGIKTSGGKAGQVTRVSSAAEFKLLIIE